MAPTLANVADLEQAEISRLMKVRLDLRRADAPPACVQIAVVASEAGPMLLGEADDAICWLSFGDIEHGRRELCRDLQPQRVVADETVASLLHHHRVPVRLHGTDFQLRVWQALCDIEPGTTATYGTLARAIKSPAASRAVGAACGRNRVSLLVPCHRAIGASGKLVGYRWGRDVKAKLLGLESGATTLV